MAAPEEDAHMWENQKILVVDDEPMNVALLEAILQPEEYQVTTVAAEARDGLHGRARTVADYIAGMTDRYAILEHRRLFDPTERT